MANAESIIKEHADLLYAWLEGYGQSLHKDKKAVKSLKKAMSGIPINKRPIYRGVTMRAKDMIKMLDGGKTSLVNRGLESWSGNPEIAFEFSPPTNRMKKSVGVMISKRKVKKGTVVIDFTNRIVQNVVQDYINENDPNDEHDMLHVVELMEREEELVTTPQCEKCELNDVEIIWIDRYSSSKLIDALKIDRDQFNKGDFMQQIISVKGKNKYELLDNNTQPWQIQWRR